MLQGIGSAVIVFLRNADDPEQVIALHAPWVFCQLFLDSLFGCVESAFAEKVFGFCEIRIAFDSRPGDCFLRRLLPRDERAPQGRRQQKSREYAERSD